MKINLNFKTSILFIVLFLVSFLANAQKKMWTGNSYVFNINSATNVTSTIAWDETNIPTGLTAGTEVLSGTRNSIYTNTFTNSIATSKVCSLSVAETVSGCVTTNTLGLEVFATPTFTSYSAITFCAGLGTAPGTLNATISNFTDIKSVTANANNFTLTYQLYDNTNTAVTGTGSTGTLTLAAGPSASTAAVTLSAGQLSSLYTLLNGQVAGSYSLKIKAFTTPVTSPIPDLEAGAVASIVTTPITIQPFTINALPLANPIIAN